MAAEESIEVELKAEAPPTGSTVSVVWEDETLKADADIGAIVEAVGVSALLGLSQLTAAPVNFQLRFAVRRRPLHSSSKDVRSLGTQSDLRHGGSTEASPVPRRPPLALIARDGILIFDATPVLQFACVGWLIRKRWFNTVLLCIGFVLLVLRLQPPAQTYHLAAVCVTEEGAAPLVLYRHNTLVEIASSVLSFSMVFFCLHRTSLDFLKRTMASFNIIAIIFNIIVCQVMYTFNIFSVGIAHGILTPTWMAIRILESLWNVSAAFLIANCDCFSLPPGLRLVLLCIYLFAIVWSYTGARFRSAEWEMKEICLWTHCDYPRNIVLVCAGNLMAFLVRIIFSLLLGYEMPSLMATYDYLSGQAVVCPACSFLQRCSCPLSCSFSLFASRGRGLVPLYDPTATTDIFNLSERPEAEPLEHPDARTLGSAALTLECAALCQTRDPCRQAFVQSLGVVVRDAGQFCSAFDESVVLYLAIKEELASHARTLKRRSSWLSLVADGCIWVVDARPLLSTRLVRWLEQHGWFNRLGVLSVCLFLGVYLFAPIEQIETDLVAHVEHDHAERGRLIFWRRSLFLTSLQAILLWFVFYIFGHRCSRGMLKITLLTFEVFVVFGNALLFNVAHSVNSYRVGTRLGLHSPSSMCANLLASFAVDLPAMCAVSCGDAFLVGNHLRGIVVFLCVLARAYRYVDLRFFSMEFEESSSTCLWMHCCSLRTLCLMTVLNQIVFLMKIGSCYMLGYDTAVVLASYRRARRGRSLWSCRCCHRRSTSAAQPHTGDAQDGLSSMADAAVQAVEQEPDFEPLLRWRRPEERGFEPADGGADAWGAAVVGSGLSSWAAPLPAVVGAYTSWAEEEESSLNLTEFDFFRALT